MRGIYAVGMFEGRDACTTVARGRLFVQPHATPIAGIRIQLFPSTSEIPMSRRALALCALLLAPALHAPHLLHAQPRPAPDELSAKALQFLPPNNPIRPDSARRYAREALASRPTALAHALLADAWAWEFSRPARDPAARDSARAHLSAALAIDSLQAHAHYVKGMLLGLAGDTAAMISAYEYTLALDPDHEMAGGNLVSTLDATGRTRDALALGARYLKTTHRNRRLLFRYGWVLGYLWENRQAEEVFRRLIAMDPGGIYGAWGYGEIAYMRRARGDAAGAIEAMETAVRELPSDGISRVGLAHMLLNAGQFARAIPMLERELRNDPAARGYGSMPAALLLGWGYLQRGDTAVARQVLDPLEQSLRTANNNDRLIELLGIEGRVSEAVAIALRMPIPRLYGSATPQDNLRTPLFSDPQYAEVVAKSRDVVAARRISVGLSPQ